MEACRWHDALRTCCRPASMRLAGIGAPIAAPPAAPRAPAPRIARSPIHRARLMPTAAAGVSSGVTPSANSSAKTTAAMMQGATPAVLHAVATCGPNNISMPCIYVSCTHSRL